jgi:tetratricopeptide (TPR) repeat protein
MDREVERLCTSASGAKHDGNPARAEALLLEALALAREKRDRADVEHRLAALLQQVGRAVECEDHARQAVELEDRTVLLANHLMFLAQHLWRAKCYEEALPFVERALPLYEQGWGRSHSETRYMLACAEFVCRKLGDEVRAAEYHRRAHQDE